MANAETRKYADLGYTYGNAIVLKSSSCLHGRLAKNVYRRTMQCRANVMLVSRNWIPATNKFILIYSCDNSAVDKRLNYYSMCSIRSNFEQFITCKRGSAKHSVKDDHAFLWEHAIFRYPPSRNPSTD